MITIMVPSIVRVVLSLEVNRIIINLDSDTDSIEAHSSTFKEYQSLAATGRLLAYWHAFVRAGFAFITSPELIAIARRETIDPPRKI
jgi:amino acid permease